MGTSETKLLKNKCPSSRIPDCSNSTISGFQTLHRQDGSQELTYLGISLDKDRCQAWETGDALLQAEHDDVVFFAEEEQGTGTKGFLVTFTKNSAVQHTIQLQVSLFSTSVTEHYPLRPNILDQHKSG